MRNPDSVHGNSVRRLTDAPICYYPRLMNELQINTASYELKTGRKPYGYNRWMFYIRYDATRADRDFPIMFTGEYAEAASYALWTANDWKALSVRLS